MNEQFSDVDVRLRSIRRRPQPAVDRALNSTVRITHTSTTAEQAARAALWRLLMKHKRESAPGGRVDAGPNKEENHDYP
jgi:hypothetical protein